MITVITASGVDQGLPSEIVQELRSETNRLKGASIKGEFSGNGAVSMTSITC